jgi:hypothetical protein
MEDMMDPQTFLDSLSHEELLRFEQEDIARECPPELTQTIDEYAADQLLYSIQAIAPEIEA